jgi:hypothetical protein
MKLNGMPLQKRRRLMMGVLAVMVVFYSYRFAT